MKHAGMKQGALAAAVLMCAAAVATGGQKQSKSAKQGAAENRSSSSSSDSASASSSISVRTENGQTTVTYKGEEVFSGQTSGMVKASSSSVNGTEYAAAFDGDKVIWENASGAAEQLKAAPKLDMPGLALPGAEQTKPAKKASKSRRGDA
jgi:hypothetical protein